MRSRVWKILLLLALVVGVVLFFRQNKNGVISQQLFGSSPVPSATPFPFQELTIPYLRNRTYQSQLGELKMYQDRSNYTSYLTSYDSDGLRVNGLLPSPKDRDRTRPLCLSTSILLPRFIKRPSVTKIMWTIWLAMDLWYLRLTCGVTGNRREIQVEPITQEIM